MTDLTGYHNWHQSQSPKVMFIDSKDATTKHDDTTHFTYFFRDSIQVKKNEGVLVSLLQASIPYSFYNVRAGVNDMIDILYGPETTADRLSHVEFAMTLPPGNYTAISLRNKFKELLEAKMAGAHVGLNGTTYQLPSIVTINFNRDTQKFEFSVEADTTTPHKPRSHAGVGRIVIFNLSHGTNAGTHFDVELGFDSDTSETSVFFAESPNGGSKSAGRVVLSGNALAHTSTPNTLSLVSDNIADLNGSVHSLYLRTNLPVISSMDSLTGGTSQIIAKIPIMSGPGSIIFHEPQNSIHKSLIQTKDIRFITIRLTDDRNRLISLNGLHFSVALMFEFVSLKWMSQPTDLRNNQRLLGEKEVEKKKKKKKKNSKTLFPKNKISSDTNGDENESRIIRGEGGGETTYTHTGIPST